MARFAGSIAHPYLKKAKKDKKAAPKSPAKKVESKVEPSPELKKLLDEAPTKPFPSKSEMVPRVVEEARKASKTKA